MTYTWHFFTTGPTINPLGRRCHRGPMIDVEVTMSKPFTYITAMDKFRAHVLGKIVNTHLTTVRTRDVVLRSMFQLLGPIFARLTPEKELLKVLICEKRRSTDVEGDIGFLNTEIAKSLTVFSSYEVPTQHLELLSSALHSNSPVVRVSGKCAVVLLASFIEMDYHNV